VPNITLIGPGAIGGLIAARLCQNPANAVTIAARTVFTELILEAADGQLKDTPRVLTRPSSAHPADWVLVATKAYDSGAAADWFPAVLNERTRVAVLQNGVDHVERFSARVAAERVLPVVVDCPAERVSPGHVRQRGPALLTVPAGEAGASFAELFAGTGVECRQTNDFTTAAWWKLCLNSAGVVNALAMQPAGVANDEDAAKLMRRIVEEAAAVGRAEGANLQPNIADEVIGIYRSHPADSVNSLHADFAASRPSEIDLRNGIIVKRGRQHGIPTPYNEMAVALVKVAEAHRQTAGEES
jgi:2-dehydropantoate 2-reductase